MVILSPTNLFPWQHFAASPAFQQQTALRLPQGGVVTWEALNRAIEEMAAFLWHQGVTPASVVAFCGKNSLKMLLLYLATIRLGAKILGLNPAFPQEKIQEISQRLNVNFCFYEDDLADLGATKIAPNFPFDPLRPATFTLTSGSSGAPKAAVHNIAAHLASAAGVCQLMDFHMEDAWLLSLPLYHVSGQGIIWRWLFAGAQLHFPSDNFYASLNQATHASLVPTQGNRWLAYLAQQPVSPKTRAVLLGGSQIPVELAQQLTQKGISVFNGYGMTEMASTICAKKFDAKAGVGLPLLGRDVKLIDDEIYVKGAGLALGYWQHGEIIPFELKQGFFKTKDKGQIIDNQWHILGRIDNMFISGGENIQPEEIEKIIAEYPQVAQVFVFGVDEQEFGKRPVALVDFTENYSDKLVRALQNFLAPRLERFKQPIAYYPLPQFNDGAIKPSRHRLKLWLDEFLTQN